MATVAAAAADEHYDCIWPVNYLTTTRCMRGRDGWRKHTYPITRSRLRCPPEHACLSSGPLYPASMWSGLVDGVVGCYVYDCYLMMGCLPSIFRISNWGLGTWMASIPRTSVSFLYFSPCVRPAHIDSIAGRPGSSEVPRNPLTRWDVSSIPANGIFLTKKLKTKLKMPNV